MKVLNLFIAILILSVSNHTYAGSNKGRFSQTKNNSVAQGQELTAEEVESLFFMREEEKLARDVYLTLYDYFGTSVFKNIAEAEQKHMNSMKRLLDQFELEDPVVNDSVGLFTNPVFTEFYDRETTNEVSLKGAILTGILIEESDIVDLQNSIDLANNADIKSVYENLLRGSRNHLRAFVRNLESMGIVYQALVIEQSVADAIVNSPVERGSSNGKGKGQSKGNKGRRWN